VSIIRQLRNYAGNTALVLRMVELSLRDRSPLAASQPRGRVSRVDRAQHSQMHAAATAAK